MPRGFYSRLWNQFQFDSQMGIFFPDFFCFVESCADFEGVSLLMTSHLNSLFYYDVNAFQDFQVQIFLKITTNLCLRRHFPSVMPIVDLKHFLFIIFSNFFPWRMRASIFRKPQSTFGFWEKSFNEALMISAPPAGSDNVRRFTTDVIKHANRLN